MHDLLQEQLVSLSEACRLLPGRPHISTAWRWVSRGVRGHRLETIVRGGRRFTSREALERFISRTTAAANGEPPPARSQRRRQREQEQARQVLSRAGIVSDTSNRGQGSVERTEPRTAEASDG